MSDPTAIDIDFDPREQRMRGVAVHGNVPFDVPFISQIDENLWTGGCQNGLILPRHIEHVVSLYPWESYQTLGRAKLFTDLKVRMYDTARGGPDPEHVRAIATWVNVCRSMGPTLAHCQAGLNRSGLVAAAALMLGGMSADEAITLLREKRSPAVLCNSAFIRWLREWNPQEKMQKEVEDVHNGD